MLCDAIVFVVESMSVGYLFVRTVCSTGTCAVLHSAQFLPLWLDVFYPYPSITESSFLPLLLLLFDPQFIPHQSETRGLRPDKAGKFSDRTARSILVISTYVHASTCTRTLVYRLLSFERAAILRLYFWNRRVQAVCQSVLCTTLLARAMPWQWPLLIL